MLSRNIVGWHEASKAKICCVGFCSQAHTFSAQHSKWWSPFFPRLIDRCRGRGKALSYKPVGQSGLTLIGCWCCCFLFGCCFFSFVCITYSRLHNQTKNANDVMYWKKIFLHIIYCNSCNIFISWFGNCGHDLHNTQKMYLYIYYDFIINVIIK